MRDLRDYLRELSRSWLSWTLLIADLIGVVALVGIFDVDTPPALVAGAVFGAAGLAWASFAVYRVHSPERAVGWARHNLHADPTAVDRLAGIPDPQATALLAECSANARGAFTRDVQIRAALRLGYRGDPRAAPGLTVCLDSSGPDEDRPLGILGEPRGQTDSGEPAAFEALCWAGRDRRDTASPWLVRVLERGRLKRQRAWAAIALHLLWAGARQPPDSVKSALLCNLPWAADPEALAFPPDEAMDRTFHANLLGVPTRRGHGPDVPRQPARRDDRGSRRDLPRARRAGAHRGRRAA